ncbi:MAG: hypothetical protein JWM40_1275, partial [Frankiales bacterium]|nr:hypothetical protein [Frankiales bacterium]
MFAPPSRIRVIPLSGSPDPALVIQAEDRLRSEPGLGAVVLSGSTVVVHEHLLYLAPQPDDPDAAWLDRICRGLIRRGYLVDGWAGPSTEAPNHRSERAMLVQLRRRWRRRRFIKAIRREAWLVGAKVHLDIAKDLDVQPGVRIEVRREGGSVRIGPRCTIASGVILRLGGQLELDRNIEIRYDVALNVKGRLVLQGRNVLGRGTMIHADGTMLLEWGACTSEYVSVLDSHHDYDGSLVHVHDQGVEVHDI